MTHSMRIAAWAGIAFLSVGTAAGQDPCLTWSDSFDIPGGTIPGEINAMAVFDDGSGSSVFVGGTFYRIGGLDLYYLARWNGSSYSAVPSYPGVDVRCMAVLDDGGGPALYVATFFNIYRWNGSVWTSIATTDSEGAAALAVFDDGTGPALYAGGRFTNISGVAANRIAKWNGVSWSALGSGLNQFVRALEVHTDASGSALYAAGFFTAAGGIPANRVAKWNGTSWSALGTGIDTVVYALASFDDGSGAKLYAGGYFDTAGGAALPNLARWDGTTWSSVGSGVDDVVYALETMDLGGGSSLYAAGGFRTAGGLPAGGIARWNGAGWTTLGSGVDVWYSRVVTDMVLLDRGSGAELYAAGSFSSAGGVVAPGIARWNGTAWSALTTGENGLDSQVDDLCVIDVGSGEKLYAGGNFSVAGSVVAHGVACWDGAAWSSLGSWVDHPYSPEVFALRGYDDGSGMAVYAGGIFVSAGGVPASNIAKWNGSGWSALGSGVGRVRCLEVFDDGSGPALYAGGTFSSAGGIPANNIAKWDGSSWSPLGTGTNDAVLGLAVFDDGSGPALYAAGYFTTAGSTTARNFAKWDGSTWWPLGSGMNAGMGFSLLVHDDGNGPALYASGRFAPPSSSFYPDQVARWTGTSWSLLGGTFGSGNGSVLDLAVFDDGSGPAIHAAGNIGGVGVLKWDGIEWVLLRDGVGNSSRWPDTLAVFDGGAAGPRLYVGGAFDRVGWFPTLIYSSFLAAWNGCSGPGELFCGGDSPDECPCPSYWGEMLHGCPNSAANPNGGSNDGAFLISRGTTNPDSVVLQANGEMPTALTIFLQGSAELSSPSIFGDGLRCVGGTLKRLYVKNAVGGQVEAPGPSDLSITARSAALGDPIPNGTMRYYMTYYRDPNPNHCLPYTFNGTNGLRITW